MNTDKLENTGNVSSNKKATSARDLSELSERELQLVTGGGGRCFLVCNHSDANQDRFGK